MGRKPSERPVPDCFHVHGAVEGDLVLKRRYGCGRALIVRWRAISGVYCGKLRGPRKPCYGFSRAKQDRTGILSKRPRVTVETISWYDAQDDIDTLFKSTGLDRMALGD